MNKEERRHDNLHEEWQRVDARILGQLLAAQNLLFVLPDEARIAEFFTEALSSMPGVTSCFVCLGTSVPVVAGGGACNECMALRKRKGDMLVMPPNFSCGWADRPQMRVIPLDTAEHTFGFFIFQVDSDDVFEPYWPFIHNLANYVGLSLENRMQKHLLEEARDDLEERVNRRTEELKHMNDRFSLATHAARLGVWDWDLLKDELVWNDQMYELYGVKKEDFAGAYEAWLQGIHPDDRAICDQISEQARRGERPYDIEFRVIWPDNSVHYLKAYGKVVWDEAGKPLRMTGINYDITERKQMVEALATQEREFRTLAENSPDNIARYDANGRTVYVNPTLEETLGCPASEMIGMTPIETALIDEFVKYHEKVTEVLKTGKEAEMDLVLPDKEGSVRFHNIRFVAERRTDGTITGVLAIGRDVTERKQVEEEIQKINWELEKRVSERTSQLESVNEELEAFAYSVSHDLRAPLRHIEGFLELLQKRTAGALDERGLHYMDTISDAANRMDVLIDDLLSFSRMGRREMVKKPVELNVLVREVIREYELEVNGRIVHWHIADLPTVSGDQSMLRAALTNLIANALKFTRHRQSAEIEIGCLPNQHAETVVFVRDNGAGFDMAYADKLFGVFQRLHRVDEFEGSGIGLANVRRIINRHGGRTWAEGEVDRGATFYFSLPESIQEV